MQEEAKSTGGFTIWHEFSWWYPWYRLHINVHVNPTIDIGFNPILLGGEVASWDGLDFFGTLGCEAFQTALIEGLVLVGTYVASRYLGIPFGTLGIAIETVKIVTQGFLFLIDWNDAAKMLAAGLVSFAMAFFALGMKAIGYQGSIFLKFVHALHQIVDRTVLAVLDWMFVQLEVIASTAIDILGRSLVDTMEIRSDIAIGLFALLRYADLVT